MKTITNFKNCNMPCLNIDEKNNICEWITNKNNEYRHYQTLETALESCAGYTCEYFYKVEEINHAHNFDDVLSVLYTYPESFSIPSKYESCYSRQQLEFIKRLKGYFKFIGLKDFSLTDRLISLKDKIDNASSSKEEDKYYKEYEKEYERISIKRCQNEMDKKYSNHRRYIIKDEKTIQAILDGNKQLFINLYNNDTEKKYKDEHWLILDSNYDIRCEIKIVKESAMSLDDLKKLYNFKAEGFKTFAQFRNTLTLNFDNPNKVYYIAFELVNKF